MDVQNEITPTKRNRQGKVSMFNYLCILFRIR